MKIITRIYAFPLALLACTAVSAADRPPNLIVIMTDDQGYGDVGFNGCRDIPTPHIDSIVRDGIRFSSGYVSHSYCSPSRAGFLTGRYQQRFGHERNPLFEPNNPRSGLPLSETMLPQALGKVGYHSGLIGKWHLGAHESFHPLKRGFDEFFGHLGGGHRYLPGELTIQHTKDARNEADSYRLWIKRNRKPVKTTEYLTDEFSREAVAFVERNRAKPFFLYLAYNAPHGPLQATEKYLSRFKNIQDKRRRTYAAMVSAVDDGVGRLLAKLKELELDEETLIFFLSDNGGPETKNASDNGPLRGAKGNVWEGGIRVPFAARWTGHLPRGSVYEKPVSSLDIFSTIAALARAPLDPHRPLDGVNLIPYLTGKKQGVPHDVLFWRQFDGGVFAVLSGDDKLVIPKKNQATVLFDLSKDIGEAKNLASQNASKLTALDKLRTLWNSELVEPVFKGLMSKRKPKRNKKKKPSTKPPASRS